MGHTVCFCRDTQVVQTGAALAYTGFVTPKDPDADTPVLQVKPYTRSPPSAIVVTFPSIPIHYITLHYVTLHYITINYIPFTLQYITLQYITLQYNTIKVHYITLYCTASHCTTRSLWATLVGTVQYNVLCNIMQYNDGTVQSPLGDFDCL
jgi:hypothetical protein